MNIRPKMCKECIFFTYCNCCIDPVKVPRNSSDPACHRGIFNKKSDYILPPYTFKFIDLALGTRFLFAGRYEINNTGYSEIKEIMPAGIYLKIHKNLAVHIGSGKNYSFVGNEEVILQI